MRLSVSYHLGVWKQIKSGVMGSEAPLSRNSGTSSLDRDSPGALSPIVGIAAVFNNLLSFHTAREALNNSQQTLKVGQPAYLNVVEVKYGVLNPRSTVTNSRSTLRILATPLQRFALSPSELWQWDRRSFRGSWISRYTGEALSSTRCSSRRVVAPVGAELANMPCRVSCGDDVR